MTELKNENPDKLREAWDAVHKAVKQFTANVPIDVRCPFCEELLIVEGMPPQTPTQWFVTCPCKKCTATLKGF